MKLLIFVPEKFNEVGGFKLPLSKYLPFLSKLYDTIIFEVPYSLKRKRCIKNVMKQVYDLNLENEEIIILSFTLNVTINVERIIKTISKRNIIIKKISFLFDSLYFFFKSTTEFNRKNNIKYRKKVLDVLKGFEYYRKEKYILKNWDDVILASPADIDFIRKNYKQINSTIHLIPNGIDIKSEKMFKTKNIDKENIKIGYIGMIKNNFDWFLDNWWPEIIKKNNKLKLIIAGKDSTKGISSSYIKKQKNVEFIGKVDDLNNFYKKCDLVIVAIRKNCGILNKVLEAFSYKVPVIGLKNNFLAFPGAYDMEHYVSFESVDDFLCKLKYILDENNYYRIAENAFKYILKNHNWKDSLDKLYAVINYD
ncbi:Glycosyltransferase involved in cell wall bisynthesis [Marinitoga hydrogenitolerans DSM 16785]|uniref:Glycosyltransferase involved in cell wall bisynthesis n=1 Tax=Marinitoga hydrogenitolerans (strain DSM 16785 / JCM 12826 / AT1271) TaxID=1122195 RepID=A0A1M5API0_MARH1|nr:glycosyltransferase family 4 protein [Marinitoga hydrogenitolerans]SHF32074.1 Glycosyltransferase involved in cell wall bisynthesis [Marinitoga hydrogenitolerans DSM 16785]